MPYPGYPGTTLSLGGVVRWEYLSFSYTGGISNQKS